MSRQLLQQIIWATLVILFVVGCGAPAATPTPIPPTATPMPSVTLIPTPTLVPILTPTPRTRAVLSQAATLYNGPGNVAYESLARVPAGTTVYPLGTYGDFVKVAVVVAGNEVTGFVWNKTLKSLPGDLPVLESLQVPWELFYLPTCFPGEYDPKTNSVTFTSTDDNWYGTESAAWALESPVRVQIEKLTVTGNEYSTIGINGLHSQSNIWWQGGTQMQIRSHDGYYVLEIRDGTSENYAASINLSRSSSQAIQILFDQPEGKSFAVLDENNHVLRTVDLTTMPGVNMPNGLFPERKLYFGAGIMAHSSLVVTGLTVGTKPKGQWIGESDIIAYLDSPGLVRLAKDRNLTIGNGDFWLDKMVDRRYCQIMQRDFNVAIVGDFGSQEVWLGPGQYNFGAVDRAVDYAHQRGWRVRGGAVWGAKEAIPDWLKNGNYTRDGYIEFLEQYVKTIVGRYKERVQEWIIANEAVERSLYPYFGGDFWNEKIGPEYIEMAFRWAREADPDGILILNSNSNYPTARAAKETINKMYETVRALNRGRKLVDVIGMQMHLFLPWESQQAPNKEEVIQTMRRFSELGERIYITEFDVDLDNRPGTQAERWKFQAGVYRDMVDACLESGVCDNFTTWGISDSLSWITGTCPGCLNESNGDPLMFDRNFIPKPAYFAVRDALASTHATATPNP